MDPRQQERLKEAVERKADAAEQASHGAAHNPRQNDKVKLDASGEMEPGIQTDDRRTQDVLSPRAKNQGKGKMTADKWNQ